MDAPLSLVLSTSALAAKVADRATRRLSFDNTTHTCLGPTRSVAPLRRTASIIMLNELEYRSYLLSTGAG